MQEDGKLAQRMLEILLRGVSTRQYQKVLPEMAESVGISKSSVSAESIAASQEQLRQLCERRLEGLELYLDGLSFGAHQVLGAIGVDSEGHKHVLRSSRSVHQRVEKAA
jgi:transposase-like protein